MRLLTELGGPSSSEPGQCGGFHWLHPHDSLTQFLTFNSPSQLLKFIPEKSDVDLLEEHRNA